MRDEEEVISHLRTMSVRDSAIFFQTISRDGTLEDEQDSNRASRSVGVTFDLVADWKLQRPQPEKEFHCVDAGLSSGWLFILNFIFYFIFSPLFFQIFSYIPTVDKQGEKKHSAKSRIASRISIEICMGPDHHRGSGPP